MANLLELMKQASAEAVEHGKPVNIVFGIVVSESPLRIDIEMKVPLEAPFLVLTRNVTDHKISMTVDHQSRNDYVVHNALRTGEKVILFRLQGGDKYLVLDRVG